MGALPSSGLHFGVRYVAIGKYFSLEGLFCLEGLGGSHRHLDFVSAMAFVVGAKVLVPCDYCHCEWIEGWAILSDDETVVGLRIVCGLILGGKERVLAMVMEHGLCFAWTVVDLHPMLR